MLEVEQRVDERLDRVEVEVVGRLVEQQHVRLLRRRERSEGGRGGGGGMVWAQEKKMALV